MGERAAAGLSITIRASDISCASTNAPNILVASSLERGRNLAQTNQGRSASYRVFSLSAHGYCLVVILRRHFDDVRRSRSRTLLSKISAGACHSPPKFQKET